MLFTGWENFDRSKNSRNSPSSMGHCVLRREMHPLERSLLCGAPRSCVLSPTSYQSTYWPVCRTPVRTLGVPSPQPSVPAAEPDLALACVPGTSQTTPSPTVRPTRQGCPLALHRQLHQQPSALPAGVSLFVRHSFIASTSLQGWPLESGFSVHQSSPPPCQRRHGRLCQHLPRLAGGCRKR